MSVMNALRLHAWPGLSPAAVECEAALVNPLTAKWGLVALLLPVARCSQQPDNPLWLSLAIQQSLPACSSLDGVNHIRMCTGNTGVCCSKGGGCLLRLI